MDPLGKVMNAALSTAGKRWADTTTSGLHSSTAELRQNGKGKMPRVQTAFGAEIGSEGFLH